MRPAPTITTTDSRIKATPHMRTAVQIVRVIIIELIRILIIILMGWSVWAMRMETYIITDATMKATFTPPMTNTRFESGLHLIRFVYDRTAYLGFFCGCVCARKLFPLQ